MHHRDQQDAASGLNVHTQHALLIGRLALAQRDTSLASVAATVYDHYTRQKAALEETEEHLLRLFTHDQQKTLTIRKMSDRHKLDLVERSAKEWASLSACATSHHHQTSAAASDAAARAAHDVATKSSRYRLVNGKKKKKRASLNPRALLLMDDWYKVNTHHPYPDDDVVDDLAEQGAISTYQVRKWMANRRVRQKLCGSACVTPTGDSSD